jgi:hypothetical protein
MKNKTARREFIKSSSSTTLGIGMKPYHPDRELWTENPDEIVDAPVFLENILHNREEVDFWLVDKTFPFTKCNSESG